MKMSKKLGGLVAIVVGSAVGYNINANAATLQVIDNTTKMSTAAGKPFSFYIKGADIAGSFTQIGQSGSFNIPNAPGTVIPVNTNVQIDSCTDASCTTIGYPTASVGWNSGACNVDQTSCQYSFWYGVDDTQWSYNHTSLQMNISVNGTPITSCSSQSNSWTNCHTDNVSFESNDTVTVTLSN